MPRPNVPQHQLWMLRQAKNQGGVIVICFKQELQKDRAFEARLLGEVDVKKVNSHPHYVRIEWKGNEAARDHVDKVGTTAVGRRFGWEGFELTYLDDLSAFRRVAEEQGCKDKWPLNV